MPESIQVNNQCAKGGEAGITGLRFHYTVSAEERQQQKEALLSFKKMKSGHLKRVKFSPSSDISHSVSLLVRHNHEMKC